ncbi:CocE/NonD family hydrolase [Neptunitalea lumnitzerae]|uniref:Xaa-Pro dipeptidyl-peptidase-like domain-containing protein n=1 Tax=Neptunitalea lumnitzerae TaxID=2965509 RepID=A0ABQ5MJL6_9FLAO|nr:CocE/NonD family hydrolase [Neptunitalea sp. Y10]GLB49611.1 hypothetical protein Y10_19790 [Neptunitalea sp. Y10]
MVFCSNAQIPTSDTNYRVSVKETLHKIEELFHITISDRKKLLGDLELDYGTWRIQPGNLEMSLTNVLAPLGLTFFKEADGTYLIRKFEYPRRSEAIGLERLTYLEGLYNTKETWEERKSSMKECMKVSLALDKAPPMPTGKPILSKIRKYKGYTVQNIGLEILPGVYTAGTIYRPTKIKGKAPVILTPNGHFKDERYRESEQIRCAVLAKMGAIVVSYDLFAWGESKLQFPVEAHHNSIAQVVEVLDGIRFLDYLATLKEADMTRVGVTGGSGGGSHTLFLAALDDRVTVSVPVVMVSSHFSGGCPCESGRPIHLCGNGTNNAEIAAMAAPKPQLIISDGGDWTSTVPELEFPFIQRTYGFYHAKDKIRNAHFGNEGHDYGVSKRMAMYPFMAKYLGLDIKKVSNSSGKIDESFVTVEPKETLYVFGNKEENLPENAITDIDILYQYFGEENYKKL